MNHQNMTQLHVKKLQTRDVIEIHTYDPEKGLMIYFNIGYIPNLGRNLTQDEVIYFNKVLKQLKIEHYVIEHNGFYELNSSGQQIRSCLCFEPHRGFLGLILVKKIGCNGTSGKDWKIAPVSIKEYANLVKLTTEP